ncbi:helix-turn-helix domain-containing protein [Lutibacter sp.]|uniref:helix-turn-helix domain-containing protein n=1 Tax=Lutibacter sp. TaxID=1925666 RepID=UPI0027331B45|nr:helix-turn-helix transcriptional regulator [Lutibacter sp.]MDP3312562.1 helix-turn-helix transcriptional regulator [Lutibacter sp.]
MGKYSISKLPSDVLKEISQKHRVLRKEAAMTQSELAERSGVSLGSIKRFERSGQISLESLLKLIHLLGRLADFELILNVSSTTNSIEKLFSNKTR